MTSVPGGISNVNGVSDKPWFSCRFKKTKVDTPPWQVVRDQTDDRQGAGVDDEGQELEIALVRVGVSRSTLAVGGRVLDGVECGREVVDEVAGTGQEQRRCRCRVVVRQTADDDLPVLRQIGVQPLAV